MIKIKDNFRFHYHLYPGPDYQDESQTRARRRQASGAEPATENRGLSRRSVRGVSQVSNRCTRRCSTKTARRRRRTPVRMATHKRQVLAKTWRKGSPRAPLAGMQTGAATVGGRPTSEYTAKDAQSATLKEYIHPMFIAASFAIAKLWKSPKCPSTDEGIKSKGTYIK